VEERKVERLLENLGGMVSQGFTPLLKGRGERVTLSFKIREILFR
jgi:hypothetical protein